MSNPVLARMFVARQERQGDETGLTSARLALVAVMYHAKNSQKYSVTRDCFDSFQICHNGLKDCRGRF